MLSLTRSGLRRAAVAISSRGSRSRGFHACSGKAWAKFTTLGWASIPKINLTPCSSQWSNSALKVKSVSPRKVICAACGATNLIARSIHGTQPSWLTTLPGRLTRVEHFVGVGQRDHQRGLAPYSLIGKSHPAFALPESRRNRAVGVDEGLCQKAPGLLPPNPLPHRVGNLHQIEDIALLKATGEVPAGGWIRNALAPRPSRKASSLRRSSISSSRTPSSNAL